MSARRERLSRREFVSGLALAGTAGLHGLGPQRVAAEPPPETTTIRLIYDPDIPVMCYAPQYVGLDPRKDLKWVAHPPADMLRALTEGQVDAFMTFPPFAQEFRARQVSRRVVVKTATDRPWSEYFCCMLAGNREFARRGPMATKRALRAILKANQICAAEPDRTARLLVEKGYARRFDLALQSLRDIPYARWRDYSPEDTLRFYGLRLHEVGMIKSSPQKLIAQGTDWRFLNELKKELKG